MQKSGDELHQAGWELASPNMGPTDSSFMAPRSAYIEGGAACIQGGGGAAPAGDGGAFLDLAHVGLFGLMESNADSSMFMMSKPSDLCVQQSTQYKQGGEERRQLSSAAQPPQPRRRANQQSYSIPTSRQLSRSVPSSPTFATSRLHTNSLMIGGGGSGATAAAGRGNRHPIIANSNQQASSSASVLTASLDLASCTSNLLPPSPGSTRSANFSSDHAAAVRPSTFSSDHAANSSNFSADQAASASPTSFTTDHAARSANFVSDQASAARPASFRSDPASRSTNFRSELAAAASLFLPFFPTTPANSTAGRLNPTCAEQDHHLQAPAGSCAANNLAKKRRLQGIKSKSSFKLAAGADGRAANEDTLASDVLPLNQGGANVEMAPNEPAEMSNNSANNEEEECGMKGNSSSITSSKTQDCEGPQPAPPKQDYIHVRARRGQATDSHSLAERVRREKISERMKFLQDLVPGCNKITGKAVMLDEIINYVQSLQRQVEFLSMKLSTVSPQTSKFEASHLINNAEPKSIQTSTTLQFNQINGHHQLHHDLHLSMPLLLDVQQAPQHHQHPSDMGAAQAWEDELQNLVQMGFPTIP